jgi:hypothetical protein
MKKVTIALAAVLGLAFVAPTIQSAQAETVIIKRGHDRGHHYGWRHRDHGNKKVVIIKHRRHHEM